MKHLVEKNLQINGQNILPKILTYMYF